MDGTLRIRDLLLDLTSMDQAPELYEAEDEEEEGESQVRRTKQTDIYALGMVCCSGFLTDIG